MGYIREHNLQELTCKAAMRYGVSDAGVLSFDRLGSAVSDKNLIYLTRAYRDSRQKQIISYPNFRITKHNMYFIANMNCKELQLAGKIDLSREDLIKFLYVLSKSNFNVVRFSHESSTKICEMLNIKKITMEELLELGKVAISEYESVCDSMTELPPKIGIKDWRDSIISHAIVDYYVNLQLFKFDGSFNGGSLLTNLGHCDEINYIVMQILLNDCNISLGWSRRPARAVGSGCLGHIKIDYRIVDELMSHNTPDMDTEEGRKEAKSRIDCFISMFKDYIGIEEVTNDSSVVNKFKEAHEFSGDFDSIFKEEKINLQVTYNMEGSSFLRGEPISANPASDTSCTDEHNVYADNMQELYSRANSQYCKSAEYLMTNKTARKRLISRINKYRYLNNTLFEACKMLAVDIDQAIRLSSVYSTSESPYKCTDPHNSCLFSCVVEGDVCSMKEADMYMSMCTGSFTMTNQSIRILPNVDPDQFTLVDNFGNVATKPYATGPFPFESYRGGNIIITNVDPSKVHKGCLFTLINRIRENRSYRSFNFQNPSVISFCEFTVIPDYIFEEFFKAMCGMVTEADTDRIQSTDDEARGISTYKQIIDDISFAIAIPSSCQISPRWGNNLIHLRKGISQCKSTDDYISMGANHIEISSSNISESYYLGNVRSHVYNGIIGDIKHIKVLLGHDDDGVPIYYANNTATKALEDRAKTLSSMGILEDKNIKINKDIKIGRRKSSVGKDTISITVMGLQAKDIELRLKVIRQIKEMSEKGHVILTGV